MTSPLIHVLGALLLSVFTMTAQSGLEGTRNRFPASEKHAAAVIVGLKEVGSTSGMADAVFVPIPETQRPDQFNGRILGKGWFASHRLSIRSVKSIFLPCVDRESHEARIWKSTFFACAVVNYRPTIGVRIAGFVQGHQSGPRRDSSEYIHSITAADVFEPYNRSRKVCLNLRTGFLVCGQVARNGPSDFHRAEYYLRSMSAMQLLGRVSINQPGAHNRCGNDGDNRTDANCSRYGYFWLQRSLPQTGWRGRWLGIVTTLFGLFLLWLAHAWFFYNPTPLRLLVATAGISVATGALVYGLILIFGLSPASESLSLVPIVRTRFQFVSATFVAVEMNDLLSLIAFFGHSASP
jgi:hypothetical protein